jgi:hypothetical protein
MTIVYAETYVVKPDKLSEFAAFCKNLDAFLKKRTDLSKEMKSFKRFSHLFGGYWGGYVDMMEFESLADLEKMFNRAMADKEFMTKIYSEFAALVIPGTDSISIWQSAP